MRETLLKNCRKLKTLTRRTEVPGVELFEEGAFPSLLPDDSSPRWGMSRLSAGNMRFRWNERNDNRTAFFSRLFPASYTVLPVELIHSKLVYAVSSAGETDGKQGDGIITRNPSLIPVITVADCMPIFLFDPVSRVFGALHSGWKGTGIAVTAIELASSLYGSRASDFRVVMGPHIHDCCYRVDRERASYFRENFCQESICEKAGGYYLSLEAANLSVLLKAGVRREHIAISDECTCCGKGPDGAFKFGSFRREAVASGLAAGQGQLVPAFTVQLAWVKWTEDAGT